MIVSVISPGFCGADKSNGLHYKLREDTAIVTVEDGTSRLLDLRGNFYALSEIATAMVRGAIEGDIENVIFCLANEHRASANEIREDANSILNMLEKASVIYPSNMQLPTIHTHLPFSFVLSFIFRLVFMLPITLVTKAYILHGFTYVLIKLVGFASAISYCKDCFSTFTVQSPNSENRLCITSKQVGVAVKLASAHGFLGAACKERALCTWILLKSYGFHSTLVIGFELYPFRSHSWCKAGDVVIGDDPDQTDRFTPIFFYD